MEEIAGLVMDGALKAGTGRNVTERGLPGLGTWLAMELDGVREAHGIGSIRTDVACPDGFRYDLVAYGAGHDPAFLVMVLQDPGEGAVASGIGRLVEASLALPGYRMGYCCLSRSGAPRRDRVQDLAFLAAEQVREDRPEAFLSVCGPRSPVRTGPGSVLDVACVMVSRPMPGRQA